MEQTTHQPNLQKESNVKAKNIRWHLLEQGSYLMVLVSGACFFLACVVLMWTVIFSSSNQVQAEVVPPTVAVRPTPTRDMSKPLIGIVSGHAGYDPGAVCPDGLTEAEVNRTIALGVIELLESKGIETDLLDEFDSRLDGYRADALVSIHADSCNIPGASGFKVARVTLSAIPEAEDQLVNCLWAEYAKATGLPEHPASITDGMTDYHAFREIASTTPGAIIETGFMLDDRFTLEYRPKAVSRGIATGIICFLNAEANR